MQTFFTKLFNKIHLAKTSLQISNTFVKNVKIKKFPPNLLKGIDNPQY